MRLFDPRQNLKQTKSAYLILALVLCFLLLPGLFLRDFWVRGEGRRVLIALEMVQGGDWLVPDLMGEPILTKPPLFYWLEALSLKMTGGPSDWAARLPSLLAAIACALSLAVMIDRLLGRRAAVLAGLMLAVALVFHGIAQSCEPEIVLVASGTLALMCFVKGLVGDGPVRRWVLPFYLFILLSFMSKGPVMPLIIILTVVLFCLLTKNTPLLKPMGSWLGLTVLFVPLIIWLLCLEVRMNAISKITQELGVHLEGDAPHSKEFTYYFDTLNKLTFPWAFWLYFAPFFSLCSEWKGGEGVFTQLFRRLRQYCLQGRGERLLLVLWFLVSILTLSVIPSKRYYYGLILAPPVIALAAMLFNDWLASGLPRLWAFLSRYRRVLMGALALVSLILLLIGFLTTIPPEIEEYDGRSTLDDKTLFLFGGVWTLGIIGILWLKSDDQHGEKVFRNSMWWLLTCMMGLVTIYNVLLSPRMNESYSLKKAANELMESLPAEGAELFTFRATHALCFYLGRPDLPYISDSEELKEYLENHPNALGIVYRKIGKRLKINRDSISYMSHELSPRRERIIGSTYFGSHRNPSPEKVKVEVCACSSTRRIIHR